VLVVTTESVPGHRVREVKGQVFGVVVRSRGLGGNIMAGLRSIFGGEITEYTQLLEEARRHAVDRMVRNASLMHAKRPDGQWQSTRERFLDPSSGEKVDVLFNPHTGERRYVSGESQRTGEPPP
jgi:Putative heavy-metal-binding